MAGGSSRQQREANRARPATRRALRRSTQVRTSAPVTQDSASTASSTGRPTPPVAAGPGQRLARGRRPARRRVGSSEQPNPGEYAGHRAAVADAGRRREQAGHRERERAVARTAASGRSSTGPASTAGSRGDRRAAGGLPGAPGVPRRAGRAVGAGVRLGLARGQGCGCRPGRRAACLLEASATAAGTVLDGRRDGVHAGDGDAAALASGSCCTAGQRAEDRPEQRDLVQLGDHRVRDRAAGDVAGAVGIAPIGMGGSAANAVLSGSASGGPEQRDRAHESVTG